MSGKFETWFNSWAEKYIPKIPFLKELSDRTERQIAGGHVTLMAMISLLPVAISMATGVKWLCVLSFISFYLIWDAEKPPVGRRIDWITRSFGWVIGCAFALIALLK